MKQFQRLARPLAVERQRLCGGSFDCCTAIMSDSGVCRYKLVRRQTRKGFLHLSRPWDTDSCCTLARGNTRVRRNVVQIRISTKYPCLTLAYDYKPSGTRSGATRNVSRCSRVAPGCSAGSAERYGARRSHGHLHSCRGTQLWPPDGFDHDVSSTVLLSTGVSMAAGRQR